MAGTERAKRVSLPLSLGCLLLLGLLLSLGLPTQRKRGCARCEAKLRSSTGKHGTGHSGFMEMGHWVWWLIALNCCGGSDVVLLPPNLQVHVVRKDRFLQNLLCLSCKIAAHGDQVHGLPADTANAKDSAVALHSLQSVFLTVSHLRSSQPSLPACAKIFAWERVDFGLKSHQSQESQSCSSAGLLGFWPVRCL